MRVLVTGGGGFLGQAVVKGLLAQGHEVRSFARGQYPQLEMLGVQVFRGDLADKLGVQQAVEGCDAVVHTAAKAGVWGPWADFYRANVLGTQVLLAEARAAGVSRFVHTSSPSVVFDGQNHVNATEELPYPKRFLAPYPASKAQAEALVLAANQADFATVALRPHLIWGPGDPHLLPRLAKAARAGRLPVVGDGTQVVDATYVDNAAEAHLLALACLTDHTVPCAGQAYFIAQGEAMPSFQLVDQLLAAVGAPGTQGRVPALLAFGIGGLLEAVHALFPALGEPKMTRFVAAELATSHAFDLTKARRDLGYQAKHTHAEGLTLLRTAFESGQYRP